MRFLDGTARNRAGPFASIFTFHDSRIVSQKHLMCVLCGVILEPHRETGRTRLVALQSYLDAAYCRFRQS